MGDKVHVVDVTPRDGLQNEPNPISTKDKLVLIEKLAAAGIKHIQATSFVHPKWVPQLADAEAVAAQLNRFPGVQFSALIPNLKGYERAVAAGIRHLEFVIAASDTFNRKNLNRSMAESLELLNQVSRRAEQDGVVLRAGFSTCFHCPFEGRISSRSLLNAVRAAREQGPWRVARWQVSRLAFVNSMPQPPGSVGALTVPERAATWPPRTSSHFWTAWATNPGLTWINYWTPRSLPAVSLLGRIRVICCERRGPVSAAWRPLRLEPKFLSREKPRRNISYY